MTYQKPFSVKNVKQIDSQSGFILYDIMLALVLSVVFIFTITTLSVQARSIFDHARSKVVLIDVYRENENDFALMVPYEVRSKSYNVASSTTVVEITAKAKWYGNDRIETDLNISDKKLSISFVSVRSLLTGDFGDVVGMPLCSVDFAHAYTVGSYEYWHSKTKAPTLTVVPINLPVNPLLPLTDLVIRNGIAYISTDSAVASDPDLIIVNIKNKLQPIVLTSLNTGPGIASIVLAGNYIFAAAASTAAQLHVIKLNSNNSVYLAKKYQIPIQEASTSPPMGSSIFYRDKNIYLGTEKWNGQEFSIIDVSNPENPLKISGIETDSKVNSIHVRGKTAYVATSGQNQLITLNIQNPASPIITNVFSPSGWSRQDGKSVTNFEDNITLGRTPGGFNITSDKELFAFASSTNTLTFDADISGGMYGAITDRNNVYAITRTLNQEFSVFAYSNGSSTVVYSLPVQPQKITCDNNSLYILAKNAPVIYEITFAKL